MYINTVLFTHRWACTKPPSISETHINQLGTYYPQSRFPAGGDPATQFSGDMEYPHLPNNSNQSGGHWTNEKHVSFLNSIEATFVRNMLENNGRHLLRLDRYLPDSSESTLDLKPQRRKIHATSDVVGPSRRRMDGRADRRTRRFSSYHHHCDASEDQVVPQLENRAGDTDERDPS